MGRGGASARRRQDDSMKSMAEKFTVGLVQMKCSTNVDENLAKALQKIREAAKRGAQIICLQELFRSQYFCREENADFSIWPSQFRGRRRRRWENWRNNWAW